MNRLALGAALGGLAVYLYDPAQGARRRDRMASVWDENRENALKAGRAASETIQSARPLARRMTEAVGRTDWTQALDRSRRPALSLPKLIGAAVVGGVFVYFMDPIKGSERRMSVMAAGRRTVQQVANAVKPLPGRIEDRVTGVVGVKSNAS
jgi:hypothetical protein